MSKISLASLDWNLKIEKILKIEPPLIFTQFFRNGGVENDDSATKKADRKKFSRWVRNPLGGVLAIFITIKPLNIISVEETKKMARWTKMTKTKMIIKIEKRYQFIFFSSFPCYFLDEIVNC